MKKLSHLLHLQIFCLMFIVSACAQSKYGVVKTHAYVRETVAGNIPADQQQPNPGGTGVDHIHSVYVETSGTVLPTWHMVYTNSGVFSVQAQPLDSTSITVGKLKNSDEMSVISAKQGNKLWKLELVPMRGVMTADIETLLKTNEMVITGEWKGEQFRLPVAKEIPLETIFYK